MLMISLVMTFIQVGQLSSKHRFLLEEGAKVILQVVSKGELNLQRGKYIIFMAYILVMQCAHVAQKGERA